MRESNRRKTAGENTMEIVAGAAYLLSIGAGASVVENSNSRARRVVEEMSKMKRVEDLVSNGLWSSFEDLSMRPKGSSLNLYPLQGLENDQR
ncbi:hypothetical protein L6452_22120 [Arctium lappa]|uniref:Uncharacterized protein n=1 Tax=Arctium lappa TaxID=4217 RepID=A0ACB9B381_ARCLA|nr:hypothetical protein L6452_22120 [Arctium lappa]